MPKRTERGAGTVPVATPTDLGALVREAREGHGWTQTDLGSRIGASRFWVAEFERGKVSVELGLALRAVAAVGLTLRAGRPGIGARAPGGVASREATPAGAAGADPARRPVIEAIDLDAIVGASADLHVG